MKLPEGPDPLEQCNRLLASAASAAAAVESFRGRWSAVAATLGRLRSSLDDLADVPSQSHPLADDLLRSLSQTLSLTLNLALHCRSPDPPAGKLRTQSDIAAASAALDQLAADADLLLRTGALLDPPPAPPAAAAASGTTSRESVRAEVRSLVTRLQIGSPASRIAALETLVALLREDDKNVLIAAAQGVVPALLRLLDSSAPGGEARAKAVAAIARIAAVESCRHVLVAEGANLLHHLARALESDGGAAREQACTALQTLTLSKDNAVAVGSRGGITALLETCRAGTPSAQAAAAGVLKNLAGVQELRENFLEENGIPVLIRLLASGTPLAQENATRCLCNLAAGEEEEGESLKLAIFKDGVLDCLKNYWETGGSGNDGSLEPAIGLLRNLSSFRYIAELAASAGFLSLVIAALDSAASGTRAEAARAISELAAVGKARKEVAGAVPRLIRMLEAKAAEEKEAAVKALASFMPFAVLRRTFRKEERGVLNVVQLLDPFVRNVDKKYPVSVLSSVSQSRRCRRQMVAAGACVFLQGLAAVEVEGAKKLLESLGRGKLWRVFPRT